MTTHIEHAVTEVIPEPEPSESGTPRDTRWTEQEKIMATLTRHDRLKRRVQAEGMDD